MRNRGFQLSDKVSRNCMECFIFDRRQTGVSICGSRMAQSIYIRLIIFPLKSAGMFHTLHPSEAVWFGTRFLKLSDLPALAKAKDCTLPEQAITLVN